MTLYLEDWLNTDQDVLMPNNNPINPFLHLKSALCCIILVSKVIALTSNALKKDRSTLSKQKVTPFKIIAVIA